MTSGGEIARDLRELARLAPDVVQRELTGGVERYRISASLELPGAGFTIRSNAEFEWHFGSEPDVFALLLDHLGEDCGVHATYDLTSSSTAQEAFAMTLTTPDGEVQVKAERPLRVLVHVLHRSLARAHAELPPERDGEAELVVETAESDDGVDILIID